MSMLEINAAKIKAEKEVVKLQGMVKQKDAEINAIAAELVATRKRNTSLEGIVEELQTQLSAKSKDCQAADGTM
jgi:hypothetical protein